MATKRNKDQNPISPSNMGSMTELQQKFAEAESPNYEYELWQSFRNGDESALQAIYEKYSSKLLAYGSTITNDYCLIEDETHDLFIELWNHRDHLGTTNNISAYLKTCLRRRLIRTLTKLQSYSLPESYLHQTLPSVEETFIYVQEFNHNAIQILKNINKLSDRQKKIIILKFYFNLTPEEISTIMNISLKSAYNLISKAKLALRVHMNYRAPQES
ncbi:MAG: sigma-70 family RNA polymerase sigma factor [Bacteroidetes bacterium]|nr:sigma-70 family RNA polymerase sigma factor [Bacteroidota bacterium]